MEPAIHQPWKIVGDAIKAQCDDVPGLGEHLGFLEVWGSTATPEIRLVLRSGLTGLSFSLNPKTARALAERLTEAAEKRTA